MSDTIQQQIAEKSQQVVKLLQQGLYKQALPIAVQVCKLARQALGEDHPNYASCLNNLAGLYHVMGNYAAAEPLYRQVLEIRHKALDEDYPDYAVNLNNLAELYREMGNYAAAEPLHREVLEIRRKAVGENHPDYATSLNNLALLYQEMGYYSAAEKLYRQALEIRRKALGENNPNYATTLNNLAQLYQAMGNYNAAEPICRQALEITRKALGENHPYYATNLNNLALLYDETGNYNTAEKLYRQGIEIYRKVLGTDHPNYASYLNNLARLYNEMGNYAAAEPLYLQALEIRRKALGEGHPYYAVSLDDLAQLYYEMGNYAAAEPLYRQALGIRRKALGENHPSYAKSLNNLTFLYHSMGNYVAAEWIYRQVLEIRRKSLGKNHPEYAESLNILAKLYQSMDKYAAAEPLYSQALEIQRKTLGENHPNYAASLNDLALLYQMMGNYNAAEPLYRQVLEIQRKSLGVNHPSYAICLNNLANLCVANGLEAEGLKLMQEAGAIDDRMIGEVFSIGSESQRMVYMATLQVNLNSLLSLVLQHLSDSHEVVQAGLELVLRRKAVGTEALAAQRDVVLGGRYPALKPKLQELMNWRAQITKKTLAGPGLEGPEVFQRLLAEWATNKERLEKELVCHIPEMNLTHKLRSADPQAVAQALPTGSVLVEFVRFNDFNFKAVPAHGESVWKPARYMAFAMKAGKPDNVKMIDLGEAQPIERMIAGFRTSISGGDRNLRLGEPLPATSTNNGTDLRRAVFDPLVPSLNGCKRLFIAPDGDLTRLPFEVLPLGDDLCLIDEYYISYLSVGRDVLRFGVKTLGQPSSPLVIADPDFELGITGAPTPTDETTLLGWQSRAIDPNELHFDPLPGTHMEGENIAAQLSVQPWLKGNALEGRLKSYPSPQILHIATHGFFLENQELDSNQKRVGTESPFGRLSHGLENPLLRSGLALAGANTWLKGKPLPLEAEDAILNAEDVSGMDLLNTELVVLSACETGLGAIQVGEGVLGLRRAFVIAGAKTLVMSLWKVPDQQTQELMEDFYHRILAGEARSEALRGAQLAMKEKYPEPLYWGAFICQGDPGPLRLSN